MTCPCDHHTFPPPLTIASGLTHLPRQIATFPDWREALLAAIRSKSALHAWRAREPHDLGVMLIEMWAYVCDAISFYDEVITNEFFIRTCRLDSSTRKLVALLGYIPRPAVGATVPLALLADGRKTVKLPASTAFRSAAFDGHPPQVFETASPAAIHALFNSWRVQPVVPATLGGGTTATVGYLLLQPRTARAKRGDWLIIQSGDVTAVRSAARVEPYTAADRTAFIRVTFDFAAPLPGDTHYSDLRMWTPRATAGLWKLGGSTPALSGTSLVLDSQYPNIHKGDLLLLRIGDDVRWFRVSSTTTAPRTILPGQSSTLKDGGGATVGSIVTPDIEVVVTSLTLDADVNDATRTQGWVDPWMSSDAADVVVHFGTTSAGIVAGEARNTVSKSDSVVVLPPHRNPGFAPGRFLLKDEDDNAIAATGSLDFESGGLSIDAATAWPDPLRDPIDLYGNVLVATRGESVKGEILGVGDARLEMLKLKLKKKPLTYLPSPAAGNDSGVANTLQVHVGGVKWREVPSFFGVRHDAEVYVVRQDEDENSYVIFGGGARPPTGSLILGSYRFGAGAATPPAGSIKQLGKPVLGLRAVRNPLAAYGGADREPDSMVRQYAPRSALLLGRIVSMADMEAAAASMPGVRAVSAEWCWNEGRQQPLAQIHYIGPAGLESAIEEKLRNLSDPNTPIDVVPATALPMLMWIQFEWDARMFEKDVRKAVRAALLLHDDGFLRPERLGIGKPLFWSTLYEAVLSVPGTLGVRSAGIDWHNTPEHAVTPGAGHYFDFETGGLLINGALTDE